MLQTIPVQALLGDVSHAGVHLDIGLVDEDPFLLVHCTESVLGRLVVLVDSHLLPARCFYLKLKLNNIPPF